MYYYRLKQIDYDGRFEYSEIITAQIKGTSRAPITLFPNPTKDGQLNLQFSAISLEDLTVQIFDTTGKELSIDKRSITRGNNLLTLNLSRFGSGIYFIKMQQGDLITYEKVIVEL